MATRFRWTVYPRDEPRLGRWIRDADADLRYALRQIRRAPGLTALIVVTLSIGIGANATMAGAIDRLLLRAPPHIERPDRVTRVLLRTRTPGRHVRVGPGLSYPAFLDLQRDVDEFEAIAGFMSGPATIGHGADAQQIRMVAATASYFRVLGVRAEIGRFFGPDDGFPIGGGTGGPPLAVLSFGFWQRQFGGDPEIVGQAIRVGTTTYFITGVAPPGFRGVEPEAPDLWLPMTVTAAGSPNPLMLEDRGAAFVSVIARLRPLVSRAQAEEHATRAVQVRNRTGPSFTDELLLESVIPGRGADRPHEVKVAIWLGGLSVLVLLIACANVANLLLARAFTRRREVAIRLAMGAGAGRLARQLTIEALLLASLGAAGAVVLAVISGPLLARMFVSSLPAGSAGLVDVRLFVFTAVIAVGTGIMVSLAPLAQSRALDLTRALRTGSTTGGGRTTRARTTLLVAQSALCVVLLVVAGLFSQSLRRVEGLDLGVDLEHTIVARFSLRFMALPEPELNANYAAMVARARAIPGVTRAALAAADPFSGGGGNAVAIHTPARSRESIWPRMLEMDEIAIQVAVDSGFFRTVQATLRGRDFDATDARGAGRVAILNAPLAQLLFPGKEPLGQCVYLPLKSSAPSGECATVIGVLQGFWYQSITDRTNLVVYVPLAQRQWQVGRPSALFVHATGDPAMTMQAMRDVLLGVRPDLQSVQLQRLTDVAAPQLKPWQLGATMFSVFGGVALAVAMVGLYGVVSFAVTQRSSEIAVRMALGARWPDVIRTVAADGMRALVLGAVIGVAGALSLRGWIGPLLFETAPGDPAIIVSAVAVLLALAVVAVILPVARALRQNPASALKAD
jgi:predicted permease